MRTWNSLHVFLSGRDESVAFVVERIFPKMEQCYKSGELECWFFMRYWHGGPHIRIRFLSSPHLVPELEDYLNEAVTSYTVPDPVSREEFYGNHSFDGEPVEPDSLPWHGEGAVKRIDYVPEVERYGGPEAVRVNEQLFFASSRVVAQLFRICGQNTSLSLTMAMRFMILTTVAQSRSLDNLKMTFHYYSLFWNGYSDQTRELAGLNALEQDEGARNMVLDLCGENMLDRLNDLELFWLRNVESACSGFREIYDRQALVSPATGKIAANDEEHRIAVATMLGSQMHMFNNRFLVGPELELFLSKKIIAAVESINDDVS